MLFADSSLSMALKKRALGQHYEQQAAHFLLKKGYQLIAQNITYRWGEIDLIALDPHANELVFCEVRHRHPQAWLRPEESIGPHKQKCLYRAIEAFLQSREWKQRGLKLNGMRIDLLAFVGANCQHWKNFY